MTRIAVMGLVIVVWIGACSADGRHPADTSSAPTSSSVTPATAPAATAPAPPVTTTPPADMHIQPDVRADYRPGLTANLFLPDDTEVAPLVVMVPGGAWRTADPEGLADLAAFLAETGIVALTVEVGSAEDEVRYPRPIEDIHCAIGFGMDRAEEAGIDPGSVVVLGHSSGAHLAALAALTAAPHSADCPHSPAPADALVGLAGVYDVARLPTIAFLLFGVSPQDDPQMWEQGNPLRQVGSRPDLPVLLLHGTADTIVPVSFTEDFAGGLDGNGHDTTLKLLPDVDHTEIFAPEVAGEIVAAWIRDLP